ncbi:zinc finger protein 436 [Scaptodrosophila lebanonensis]|uniref:Zinc finger protein 436 n=1 Tax=Drosophila lebanonensis TaxID=7225 RepID=A0A6J2TIC8_DROLE|nr:zinc finger protein 436 [Scaptodrosophila lebanonensis]
MLLENVCRICANTIKDMERSRNLFTTSRGKLLLQLSLITGVQLTKQKNMPERACERCNSELELAMKFRERCIFSQKYLNEILKKERVKQGQHLRVESDEPDMENIEKTERTDDKKSIMENGEVLTEPEMSDNSVRTTDEVEAALVEEAQLAESHLEELEKQTHNPPERRPNFYICQQCGKYFGDQKKYKSHLIQHTQAGKKIECNLCPQTFASKLLLKQHQKTHCTDRRHKCKKCGRCFAEIGAYRRHEKAHANERPYPCLECEKNFESSEELKKHATSHVFRCEPCNKDFGVRDDLLAHSNTLPHKRNVQQMQMEIDFLCAEDDNGVASNS